MACRLRSVVISFKHPKFYTARTIMTTSKNFENAMENLQSNPYYEKYAERIAAVQKKSPEEFQKRVETQDKNKDSEKKFKFSSTVDTSQFSSVLNPKKKISEDVCAQDRKLNDIFKLELVHDKDATEVQVIWEEYHKDKEVISAIIPKENYNSIKQNMRNFPTFLFPLPRTQGYEFIMCQSSGNAVHLTPLLAFQVHKENAPECLTMVHYTELQEKGIILMRGDYDKNVLTGKEAQCLANQFQMYYSGKDPKKHQLLELFNKSPDKFKHVDLIAELESIELV